jgi:hypothetical protein
MLFGTGVVPAAQDDTANTALRAPNSQRTLMELRIGLR